MASGSGRLNLMGGSQLDEEYGCKQMCPELSYSQRITGFVTCGVIGVIFSFAGSMLLFQGTAASLTGFAVLYIFGVLINIMSSLFLGGPGKQCQRMWDQKRIWSTVAYFMMIVITFAVAVSGQHVAVVLCLLLVTYLTGIWWSASFIPFGRDVIKSCCTSINPCKKA